MYYWPMVPLLAEWCWYISLQEVAGLAAVVPNVGSPWMAAVRANSSRRTKFL